MLSRAGLWLAVAATLLVVLAAIVFAAARQGRATHAELVGSAACARCHAAEFGSWQHSQHAVAMQEATPRSVLGRFDSTTFPNEGVTSTFFRRGDEYLVNTEGADGALHDYTIRYTFGVYPLQQYLVSFPGGRMQALSVAWDTRPANDGGQRWFFLFPGPRITHTDELHWTGRQLNWNYMCADCHSTAVRKGYVASADTFHTTFAEVSVGCEACHGPGSTHVRWAGYPTVLRRILGVSAGMPARLDERRGVRWVLDSGARIAHRSTPRTSDREIEVCAQCHARRFHIADGYTAGARLLDYYIPSLLQRGLYYPDGQQRDEVYDYGSFLQSRMYAAGVTCADCHDPHTEQLRRPGNQVCTQCHVAAAYDTPAHHFHPSGSAGAQCAACHMPTTTYMRIDPRHDHSIRVPRPDRSITMGVPNACNRCHTDRDARWAEGAIRAHHPNPAPGFQRFASAFALDDSGSPAAPESLAVVTNDRTEPAIVRASALARLGAYPGPLALEAARAWARDPSTLVRLAALQALEPYPARDGAAIAARMLDDSTRAVRQGAAWLVAADTSVLATPDQHGAFARAVMEFVGSQRYNADQAANRVSLGAFYARLGRLDSAAAVLRSATALAPQWPPAWLALAAVLRAEGQAAEAAQALREGLAHSPGDPDLTRALASPQ